MAVPALAAGSNISKALYRLQCLDFEQRPPQQQETLLAFTAYVFATSPRININLGPFFCIADGPQKDGTNMVSTLRLPQLVKHQKQYLYNNRDTARHFSKSSNCSSTSWSLSVANSSATISSAARYPRGLTLPLLAKRFHFRQHTFCTAIGRNSTSNRAVKQHAPLRLTTYTAFSARPKDTQVFIQRSSAAHQLTFTEPAAGTRQAFYRFSSALDFTTAAYTASTIRTTG